MTNKQVKRAAEPTKRNGRTAEETVNEDREKLETYRSLLERLHADLVERSTFPDALDPSEPPLQLTVGDLRLLYAVLFDAIFEREGNIYQAVRDAGGTTKAAAAAIGRVVLQ